VRSDRAAPPAKMNGTENAALWYFQAAVAAMMRDPPEDTSLWAQSGSRRSTISEALKIGRMPELPAIEAESSSWWESAVNTMVFASSLPTCDFGTAERKSVGRIGVGIQAVSGPLFDILLTEIIRAIEASDSERTAELLVAAARMQRHIAGSGLIETTQKAAWLHLITMSLTQLSYENDILAEAQLEMVVKALRDSIGDDPFGVTNALTTQMSREDVEAAARASWQESHPGKPLPNDFDRLLWRVGIDRPTISEVIDDSSIMSLVRTYRFMIENSGDPFALRLYEMEDWLGYQLYEEWFNNLINYGMQARYSRSCLTDVDTFVASDLSSETIVEALAEPHRAFGQRVSELEMEIEDEDESDE